MVARCTHAEVEDSSSGQVFFKVSHIDCSERVRSVMGYWWVFWYMCIDGLTRCDRPVDMINFDRWFFVTFQSPDVS